MSQLDILIKNAKRQIETPTLRDLSPAIQSFMQEKKIPLSAIYLQRGRFPSIYYRVRPPSFLGKAILRGQGVPLGKYISFGIPRGSRKILEGVALHELAHAGWMSRHPGLANLFQSVTGGILPTAAVMASATGRRGLGHALMGLGDLAIMVEEARATTQAIRHLKKVYGAKSPQARRAIKSLILTQMSYPIRALVDQLLLIPAGHVMRRFIKSAGVSGSDKVSDMEVSSMRKEGRDMPSFLKQKRPQKVKDIYKALKREHPSMPAEVKARIAAKFGKPGKQEPGPPYKGSLHYKRRRGRYVKRATALTGDFETDVRNLIEANLRFI